MTELDHVWSQMLVDAEARAGDTGRKHLIDYLRLRATNDAIRAAAVDWLFDAAIEMAGPAMRGPNAVTIERENPHTFVRGSSTMVGSLLRIRQGVRCLSIEAGWVRTPSDGIMQKGALVYARISHFGMPKAGGEIRLVHAQSLPQWLDADGAAVGTGGLRRHFDVFLGP